VGVEDDPLGIDLGPANAQALEKSEVGTAHWEAVVASAAVCQTGAWL
jgi:hypothetical protein